MQREGGGGKYHTAILQRNSHFLQGHLSLQLHHISHSITATSPECDVGLSNDVHLLSTNVKTRFNKIGHSNLNLRCALHFLLRRLVQLGNQFLRGGQLLADTGFIRTLLVGWQSASQVTTQTQKGREKGE